MATRKDTTKAEKFEEAKRLKAEGLTHREIGERLGVAKATVGTWFFRERYPERSREHSRRWKTRNKERVADYASRYHEEHKHPCAACGHLLAQTSTGENCPRCIEKRDQQIVEWWAEGLKQREIAERLGWTTNHLNVQIVRLRARGYDLPHRYRMENGRRIPGTPAEARAGASNPKSGVS